MAAVPLVRAGAARDAATDLAGAMTRSRALKPDTPGGARNPAIVFACDAGMGSSVIGMSILARKIREAALDADVTHTAIAELPLDAGIVVVHASLEERARRAAPRATVYTVTDFVHSPAYDEIVDALRPRAATELSPSAPRGAGR
jgi:PTS system mannitol-specific IIC component